MSTTLSPILHQLKAAKVEYSLHHYQQALALTQQALSQLDSFSSSSSSSSVNELRVQAHCFSGRLHVLLGSASQAWHCYQSAWEVRGSSASSSSSSSPSLNELDKAIEELLTRSYEIPLPLKVTRLFHLERLLTSITNRHHQPSNKGNSEPIQLLTYTLSAAAVALEVGQWQKALHWLYPLVGLSQCDKEDQVNENLTLPPVERFVQDVSKPALPPLFYRLLLGLHLQMDQAAFSHELNVRVTRQMQKLKERRATESVQKEKEDKKKLDALKKQNIKRVEMKMSKEGMSEQAERERQEERQIEQRVKTKLEQDWSLRHEAAWSALYSYCLDCGLTCDAECQHMEETTVVKRRISIRQNRLASSYSSDTFNQVMVEVQSDLEHLFKTHSQCMWATEQWCLLQCKPFHCSLQFSPSTSSLSASSNLTHFVHLFPSSWLLRNLLAVSLLTFHDETQEQARSNSTAFALQAASLPPAFLTPLLEHSSPFAPLYILQFLGLFAQVKRATSLGQVSAALQAIDLALPLLEQYISRYAHDLRAQLCSMHVQLLKAEALSFKGLDREGVLKAESIFTQYIHHADDSIRMIARMGMLKVALFQKHKGIDAATQAVRTLVPQPISPASSSFACLIEAYLVLQSFHLYLHQHSQNIVYISAEELVAVDKRFYSKLRRAYDMLREQNLTTSFPAQLLLAQLAWTLGSPYREDPQSFYTHSVAAARLSVGSMEMSRFALSSVLFDRTEAFVLLGRYSDQVNQPVRALQFYQKALKLTPHNEHAGLRVARDLRDQAQLQRVISLGEAAIQSNKGATWAHCLQARCYAHQQLWTRAIASYQQALRVCTMPSSLLWEELGEAYFHVGSLIAAMKAWRKAVELNPSNYMAHYGIARIFLGQRCGQEAIEAALPLISSVAPSSSSNRRCDLEDLRLLPQPVSMVVWGLRLVADAYLGLAVEALKQGAWLTAQKRLEACIESAQSCLSSLECSQGEQNAADSSATDEEETAQKISLFKLLGDAHALFQHLSVDPLSSVLEARSQHEPFHETHKWQHLLSAESFYARACALKSLPTIHYDRGLNLRQLSFICWDNDKQKHFQQQALIALKTACDLAPDNSYLWLALAGTFNSFAGRHLCLVEALRPSHKQPEAWLHLALTYLQHGDGVREQTLGAVIQRTRIGDGAPFVHLEAARLAMELAQALDPENPTLWFAQGVFNAGFDNPSTVVLARQCFERSVELACTHSARLGLCLTALQTCDWILLGFHSQKLIEQKITDILLWQLCALSSLHEQQWASALAALDNAQKLHSSEGALKCEEVLQVQKLRCIKSARALALFHSQPPAEAIKELMDVLDLDLQMKRPRTDVRSLQVYEFLIQVYTTSQMYQQATSQVLECLAFITEAQSELPESQSDEVLRAAYHRILLRFLDVLCAQHKQEEALYHIQQTLEREDVEDDSSCELYLRRYQLLERKLTISSQMANAAMEQKVDDRVSELLGCAASLQNLTGSHSQRSKAHQHVVTIYISLQMWEQALSHLKKMVELNSKLSIEEVVFILRNLAMYFPKETSSSNFASLISPLPLTELPSTGASPFLYFVALSTVYVTIGRMSPPSTSLAEQYEREMANTYRLENGQMLQTEEQINSEQIEKEDSDLFNGYTDMPVTTEDDNSKLEYHLPASMVTALSQESDVFRIAASHRPSSHSHNAFSLAAKAIWLCPSSPDSWKQYKLVCL